MISTITKRADFIYLKRNGKRIKSNLLKVVYAKYLLENKGTKVAYIASKKSVGNAVKRNKAKRRLRSLVREYSSIIPNNYLLLFIASSKTYCINYQLLKNELLNCLERINRVNNSL